jgi:glycogen debranching enzyme
MGAFVEAWLRVNGDTPKTRADARRRFVEPFVKHLDEAGLGHISEITDGDPPHSPCGCPFQAWSLGEFLRIEELTKAGHLPDGTLS